MGSKHEFYAKIDNISVFLSKVEGNEVEVSQEQMESELKGTLQSLMLLKKKPSAYTPNETYKLIAKA